MDNLNLIENFVDERITNERGVGSIKAAENNKIYKDILQKVGRYTGFPYRATKNGVNGAITSGIMSFNSNAMNQDGTFSISLNVNTLDANPIQVYLDLMTEGSLVHFKDYKGRSVIYQYVTYVLEKDNFDNDILTLSVKSVKGNTNYIYQINDNELCIVEFFTKGANNSGGESGTAEGFKILNGNRSIQADDLAQNLRSNAAGITLNIPEDLENDFYCAIDNAFEQMFLTVSANVVFSGDTEGKSQPFVIPKNGTVIIQKSFDVVRIKGDIL